MAACNNETHYICTAGKQCLPLEWRCDNVADCPDGSVRSCLLSLYLLSLPLSLSLSLSLSVFLFPDEINCSYLHLCEAGEFNCNNGDCVDKKFKCDGFVSVIPIPWVLA